MLTLRDALRLPILMKAKVVAGAGELDRPIRWLHNVGMPNAADWLHGGELVLTTFYNMPESPAEQVEFVRQLADKGIVALVITVGMLVEAIPDYLRTVGDELRLPLIELPYQIRFVDIAKVINERISEESLDTVSRALSIQGRLSRLVLEGGGFAELAEMLADQVGHSISIENERFEAIANKNIAEVDSARRYTIEQGRTNPLLIEALEVEYLPKIRESLRPVQLPMMPDLGLEMERLLAPIVVHGEIYGYMWIIADVHALSPLDMMAIEIGATVAALLMLHRDSLQAAEASLKGSLLAQLIEGDGGPRTILSDQSLRYGVDLRSAWRLLLVHIRKGHPPASTRAYRNVNRVLSRLEARAVAAQFAGQVVILAQDDGQVEGLTRAVHDALAEPATIGLSARFSGAEAVGAAHQQCNEALEIGRKLAGRRSLHRFDELGYLHALYQAGPGSLRGNAEVALLRRLLDEQGADLFRTLEAYLDAGGNGVQTAEALNIHRSTLNYRLARIRQLCEVDLASPAQRLNLHVALKLMRLFDET